MKKYVINILLLISTTYIFTACSSKQTDEEYNKPAIYWYNKMIKQISNYQIEEADDTFTSLESEHRNSPLLPSAMMIIATTHMEEEEYAMANYYFDEYLKRFSLKRNADYIRYLKIKSNFLAFKSQFREQELLDNTLKDITIFVQKYPDSEFIHLVNTIKSRLLISKALFDKEIADLYGRIDKPQAQKLYDKKAASTWDNQEHIIPVDVPWYQAIFE